MGFAFALGMIDALQAAHFNIGWIYAIAPENPSAGYIPKNIEGIWQYGSQESDRPFNRQDGIAPQAPIPGLTDAQRVPIDANAPQNFLESHMIGNYSWVFKQTTKGNVKSRK